MASTASIVSQYQFFRDNYPSGNLDSVFVESILIPGLAKQGQYSAASDGIELPHGDNVTGDDVEYLKLSEAAALAIEFLTNHNLIREGEQIALDKIASRSGYTQLANTLQLIVRERISDPNKLLSSRLAANLAEYHEYQKSQGAATPAENNYYDKLQAFVKLRQKAEQLALAQLTPDQIAALLPQGMPELYGKVNKQAIISLVISQLPDLVAKYRLHPESSDLAARAVTRHLEETLKSAYPELVTTHNFLYAEEDKIVNFVQTAAAALGDNNLRELASARETASRALPHLTPSYSSLSERLVSTLSTISDEGFDPAKTSQIILTVLTSSSGESLTKQELYSRIRGKLNLGVGQFSVIAGTLDSQGVGNLLAYHQNKLALQRSGLRLTASENKLLKLGANPFLLSLSHEDLRAQAKLLLPDPLPDSHRELADSIQSLYDLEGSSDTSQDLRLRDLKSWLDHHRALSQIESDRKLVRLANRAQRERRFYELPISGKWIEIEETITGRRFVRQIIEKWDHFAENVAVVKVGKTKVPVFRLLPWGMDKWHQFKKVTAIKWLKGLRGTRNPFGRFAQFSLRHYLKSDLTWSGAFYSGMRELWSKRIVVPVIRWTTLKYLSLLGPQRSGIFKYLALKAAGSNIARAGARTATRFLLKIGGKGLAKLGSKAIVAIGLASTGIGGVVSAILTGLMIFDLLRLGFDFVKEFVRNVDFRNKILKLGGIFGGLVTLGWLAPLGLFLAGIGVLVLQTLLVAAAWTLGLIAGFTLLFNVFQHSIKLDSAPGRLIASIICDESGEGGNPRLNTAICIAQILTDCSINPLTSGNANSSAWQCALASLIADDAMTALKTSATKYQVLQCVGFVVAVDLATGGSGSGFGNAKTLCDSVPSGWRCVQGVGSCAPGDIFVSKGGAWGHTGIVADPLPGSPYIQCLDANGGGPGIVRNSEECRYPKSSIYGCLKRSGGANL